MAKDPTAVATKWSRNLAASTQSITDGVNAVTVNPAATASAKSAKWQAAMQDPATLAKYKAGLDRTTIDMWKQSMLTKGVARIAQGAQQAYARLRQKVRASMDNLPAPVFEPTAVEVVEKACNPVTSK